MFWNKYPNTNVFFFQSIEQNMMCRIITRKVNYNLSECFFLLIYTSCNLGIFQLENDFTFFLRKRNRNMQTGDIFRKVTIMITYYVTTFKQKASQKSTLYERNEILLFAWKYSIQVQDFRLRRNLEIIIYFWGNYRNSVKIWRRKILLWWQT